ncbi:MAG: nuclease-like protein [Pseudomonadota bacterium]
MGTATDQTNRSDQWHGQSRSKLAGLLLAVLLSCTAGAGAYEISSSAIVNDDGSLRIKGKTIHLFGIYIPPTGRTCDQHRRPTVCGSRAHVALDFKIDGFVRCDLLTRNEDRSYIGRCRVNASHFSDGDDLSAYLLQKGWAVATPDAPIEYQTLEKIARQRGFGVWGIPIDNIRK